MREGGIRVRKERKGWGGQKEGEDRRGWKRCGQRKREKERETEGERGGWMDGAMSGYPLPLAQDCWQTQIEFVCV